MTDLWSEMDWQARADTGRDLGGRHLEPTSLSAAYTDGYHLRRGQRVLDRGDACVVEWGDDAWLGTSWLRVEATGAKRRIWLDQTYPYVSDKSTPLTEPRLNTRAGVPEGQMCEAWTGSFDQGGATACGRPASARLEASWGSSWYVCPLHDVRTP